MDIEIIAKSLEIFGVFLGNLVVGIFLRSRMEAGLGKLDTWRSSVEHKDKRWSKWLIGWFPVDFKWVVVLLVISIIIDGTIIVGILWNSLWLLGTGISLLCLTTLCIFSSKKGRSTQYSPGTSRYKIPLYIFLFKLTVCIIVPITYIPPILLQIVGKTILLVIKPLTGIRIILLFLGSMSILVGLILELITKL